MVLARFLVPEDEKVLVMPEKMRGVTSVKAPCSCSVLLLVPAHSKRSPCTVLRAPFAKTGDLLP